MTTVVCLEDAACSKHTTVITFGGKMATVARLDEWPGGFDDAPAASTDDSDDRLAIVRTLVDKILQWQETVQTKELPKQKKAKGGKPLSEEHRPSVPPAAPPPPPARPPARSPAAAAEPSRLYRR